MSFLVIAAGSFNSQNVNNFASGTQVIVPLYMEGESRWYKFISTGINFHIEVKNNSNVYQNPAVGLYKGQDLENLEDVGGVVGTNGAAVLDVGSGLVIGDTYMIALAQIDPLNFFMQFYQGSAPVTQLGDPIFTIPNRNEVTIAKATADAGVADVKIYYRIKDQPFPWTLYTGTIRRGRGNGYKYQAQARKDGYTSSNIVESAALAEPSVNGVDPCVPCGSRTIRFRASNNGSFYAIAVNESPITYPYITLVNITDGVIVGRSGQPLGGQASLQLFSAGTGVLASSSPIQAAKTYEILFSGLQEGYTHVAWNLGYTLADVSAPALTQSTQDGQKVLTIAKGVGSVAREHTFVWRFQGTGSPWKLYTAPFEVSAGQVIEAKAFASATKLSAATVITIS